MSLLQVIKYCHVDLESTADINSKLPPELSTKFGKYLIDLSINRFRGIIEGKPLRMDLNDSFNNAIKFNNADDLQGLASISQHAYQKTRELEYSSADTNTLRWEWWAFHDLIDMMAFPHLETVVYNFVEFSQCLHNSISETLEVNYILLKSDHVQEVYDLYKKFLLEYED